MNKIILFLLGFFIIGCKATPMIVNEKNSQGYIITDKNASSSAPLAEVIETTNQPLNISWWWIIWIICFVALIVYIIKFIKLFNK